MTIKGAVGRGGSAARETACAGDRNRVWTGGVPCRAMAAPGEARSKRPNLSRSTPTATPPTTPTTGPATTVGTIQASPGRRHGRRPEPDRTSGDIADAERLSDVDEWVRSQHLRDILAKLYDPLLLQAPPGRMGGVRQDPPRGRRADGRQPRGRHPGRRPLDHARHRARARSARLRSGRRGLREDAARQPRLVVPLRRQAHPDAPIACRASSNSS